MRVIIVKMTDEHQIGRNTLPAINVNRMRIENNPRALGRGQIKGQWGAERWHQQLALPRYMAYRLQRKFPRTGGDAFDAGVRVDTHLIGSLRSGT